MLARIIRATRANPCTCPPPKKGTEHKNKVGKPYYYVESPRNVPLPITITHFRDRKPIIRHERKTTTKFPEDTPNKKRIRFIDGSSKKDDDSPKHSRPRSLTLWPKGNSQEHRYPWDDAKPKAEKPVPEKTISHYYQYHDEPKKEKDPSMKSIPYYKQKDEPKYEREKSISNKDDMSLDQYNALFLKDTTPPPTTVQFVKKKKTKKPKIYDYEPKTSRLSAWYQKRKTYRELKAFYAKERKRENKERLEREMACRIKEEELLSKLRGPTTKVNKKHKKKMLYGTAHETRHVSVKKKRVHHEDCTHRFVNCCYRLCCQFYCCLTCIVLFSLFIIFML